jgi:hypothetical protein
LWKGQFGRLRQKVSPPPVWEIQFRLILHLKAQNFFDNALQSSYWNFDSASLWGHVNFSFPAKFLKCSVWEAQPKGISSTSFEDTVSAHTASKSTRLVWQSIKFFFWNFGSASLESHVNFSFLFWIMTKFSKQKKLRKCFKIFFS